MVCNQELFGRHIVDRYMNSQLLRILHGTPKVERLSQLINGPGLLSSWCRARKKITSPFFCLHAFRHRRSQAKSQIMMFPCKYILLPQEPDGAGRSRRAEPRSEISRTEYWRSCGCTRRSVEMNDQIVGITTAKPALKAGINLRVPSSSFHRGPGATRRSTRVVSRPVIPSCSPSTLSDRTSFHEWPFPHF